MGGPARYVRVRETGGKLGFITPLTPNFCESCNRVRLTCTGQLFMCLGQEDAADLRVPVRASNDDGLLMQAIGEAISRKPKGHDFIIDRRHTRSAVGRHMSMTGVEVQFPAPSGRTVDAVRIQSGILAT